MAKIVNHGFPNENNEEIGVVEQQIQFIQHSDTMDSDRYQYLRFETEGVEFDPKDNTDSFFRISTGDKFAYNPDKTDVAPFWSCNGPEELVKLFNEAARRFGMSCRWKVEKYYVKPNIDPVKERILTEEELEQIVADHKQAEEERHAKILRKAEIAARIRGEE